MDRRVGDEQQSVAGGHAESQLAVELQRHQLVAPAEIQLIPLQTFNALAVEPEARVRRVVQRELVTRETVLPGPTDVLVFAAHGGGAQIRREELEHALLLHVHGHRLGFMEGPGTSVGRAEQILYHHLRGHLGLGGAVAAQGEDGAHGTVERQVLAHPLRPRCERLFLRGADVRVVPRQRVAHPPDRRLVPEHQRILHLPSHRLPTLHQVIPQPLRPQQLRLGERRQGHDGMRGV